MRKMISNSGILCGVALGALIWLPAARAQRILSSKPLSPPSSRRAASSQPAVAGQRLRSEKKPARPARENPAAKSGKTAAKPVRFGKLRDPFTALVNKKKAGGNELPLHLPPGKKGLVIGQLQLEGIATTVTGELIAVVDNKTKRAYFLHKNDRLYNGKVWKILPDRIVYMETSSDKKKAPREVVQRLDAPE